MSCSSTSGVGWPLQSLLGSVPLGIVPVQESVAVCPVADGTVTLPDGGFEAPIEPVTTRRIAAANTAVSGPANLRIYCLLGSPQRMGDAKSGGTIPRLARNATFQYFLSFTSRRLTHQSELTDKSIAESCTWNV